MIRFIHKKYSQRFYLITGITVILIFFEIIPRFVGLIESSLKVISSSSKLTKSQELERKYNALVAQNIYYKKLITSLVSDYEDEKRISDVYKILNEANLKSGTRLVELKSDEIRKKENLWYTDVEIILEGSYEGFYNLLNYIEQSPKTIKVVSIQMKKKGLKKTQIEANIKLTVYLNI